MIDVVMPQAILDTSATPAGVLAGKGLPAGNAASLPKPYTRAEVLTKVKLTLDHRRTVREMIPA